MKMSFMFFQPKGGASPPEPRIDVVAPWLYTLATVSTIVCLPIMLVGGMYGDSVLLVLVWILLRGIERRTRTFRSEDILYFRAFKDNNANAMYDKRLKPVLACFGRPMEISATRNYDVDSVARFINCVHRTPGRLGHIQLDEPNWKSQVVQLVKQARFAVLDLSTVTDNVLWELNTALKEMGKDHVLALFRDPRAVLDVGSLPIGISYLCYSSSTLEQEAAALLAKRTGRPGWFARRRLEVFLERGRCFWYWVFALTEVLLEEFAEGLSGYDKFHNINNVTKGVQIDIDKEM